MRDPLTTSERSALMAKVRGKGNLSTEGRVEQALLSHGLRDWTKHPGDIQGKPDFYFPSHRLAVFVDGCFWHSCPKCARNTPTSRRDFWLAKISENQKRDNTVRRKLRTSGYHVMRIWEHELKTETWLKRLKTLLRRTEAQIRSSPR